LTAIVGGDGFGSRLVVLVVLLLLLLLRRRHLGDQPSQAGLERAALRVRALDLRRRAAQLRQGGRERRERAPQVHALGLGQ